MDQFTKQAIKCYIENRFTRHLPFIPFLTIKIKVGAMNLFLQEVEQTTGSFSLFVPSQSLQCVFYAATASVSSKRNTEKKSSVIPMNDGVGQTWPSRRVCILTIERRKSGQCFSCLNYLRNFHIACSACAKRDPDSRLQYY